MKSVITGKFEGEEREEIEESFRHSHKIRERIVEILKDKIDTNRRSGRSREALASPSWAYGQAYDIGRESAFSEIISLLSEKNVEND